MALIRPILAFFAVFLLTLTAFAEEKITNFDVLIDVQTNGDFIVTETIAVDAEGRKIRRGIFRDIPRYQLLDGEYKVPQRISVMSIGRDGKRSPFMKENVGNALQIKIGDADVFLDPGAYAYEIKYRMKNQVRYFDNHDEVFWNTTGTYWAFPIEKASAIVRLPSGAVIQDQGAYTGRKGSTEQTYRYQYSGDDHIFTAGRPLAPREGMTVSLSFDKGLIDPPTAAERGFLWWVKNAAPFLLAFTLLGITGYYYRAWNRVGRDPAKGPIFARYSAPEGYSPAGVSHIHYKGVKGHKALIATLVGLATKGYLDIDAEKKSKTEFTRLDPHNAPPMNGEETALFQWLFPRSNSRRVTLKGKTNSEFYRTTQAFNRMLGKAYGKDYQRWNLGWVFGGFFLSAIALAAALSQTYGVFRLSYAVLIIGLIAVNIIFAFLMPAPTKIGQDLGTEIDGFRLYIKTAEKKRLDAVDVGSDQPPPMTTDRYEAILPFAIALGVEGPWSKYFEAVMPEEAKAYNPSWSSGNFSSGRSLSRMTDSMVSNISSGATSAAPPSSSSSGGGGGGSSGGGGGGGGGGGW